MPYIIEIYSRSQDIAHSILRRCFGIVTQLCDYDDCSKRVIPSLLKGVKNDNISRNNAFNFLNYFANSLKLERHQVAWKLEILSYNLPESFKEIKNALNLYFDEWENTEDYHGCWDESYAQFDVLSNFVKQVVLNLDYAISEQLLEWLTGRKIGFSVGAIGCMMAAKSIYESNKILGFSYFEKALKIIAFGVKKHNSYEIAKVNRTILLFLSDCAWAAKKEIFDEIADLDSFSHVSDILEFANKIAFVNFKSGVEYSAKKIKGFNNKKEYFLEAISYIVCETSLNEGIDRNKILERKEIINKIALKYMGELTTSEYFQNRERLFQVAFGFLSSVNPSKAIDIFNKNNDDVSSYIDRYDMFSDIARNICNKNDVKNFLSAINKKKHLMELNQCLVLLLNPAIKGTNEADKYLKKLPRLIRSIKFDNSIKKLITESIILHLNSDSPPSISKGHLYFILCQYSSRYRNLPDFDKDFTKPYHSLCLCKYCFKNTIDYLSNVDDIEEHDEIREILVDNLTDCEYTINDCRKIFNSLESNPNISKETKDEIRSNCIKNCKGAKSDNLLKLADDIEDIKTRSHTKLNIINTFSSKITICNKIIENLIENIETLESIEKAVLYAKIGIIYSQVDNNNAIHFISIALECIKNCETTASYDNRSMTLLRVIEECVKSFSTFDKKLFEILFENALVFKKEITVLGVNVALFYMLASWAEDLGEDKYFRLCINTIKKAERDCYASHQCLGWIHDKISGETFTICVSRALTYCRLDKSVLHISNERTARIIAEKIASKNMGVFNKLCQQVIKGL